MSRTSLLLVLGVMVAQGRAELPQAFFEKHCNECHDADTHKGSLDLTSLKPDFADADTFARWVKVHDRIESGEMPPKKSERPPADAVKAATGQLHDMLVAAERQRLDGLNQTQLRRLTRGEYENTVRDLLSLPGISLQSGLPADGMAQGFDKNAEALDMSHVNLARYMEAADRALDMAIATRPQAPAVMHERLSLTGNYITRHVLTGGDGVLLRDQKPDPNFLPPDEHKHIDLGAHERLGLYSEQSSVGLFRTEDEGFSPEFSNAAILYPGRYRIRASFWAFQWDKGQVLPARGTECARLSATQLRENGRGATDGSRVLGYYDAPSLKPAVHEFETWLNYKETIGFAAASLAPVTNYNRKGHAMAFTGPGIASDWLELEGPLNDVWPPAAHRVLFGSLPIEEFKAVEQPGVHAPTREPLKQEILQAKNKPDPQPGIWTVHSGQPEEDARRLLSAFLPRAIRHPVAAEVCDAYVAKVRERLKAGDCFETAMRWAYRAALCSPDFLYHVEVPGRLDEAALACRLAYLFWNSMPDDELVRLAATGTLHEPATLHAQVERLLKDPRSSRFIEDFTGQWLKLRLLSANDPDKKLYPEFSPYLQDSMRMETQAYFRELMDRNLDASYLVQSDFAMLNEKLAVHYGVPGVSGPGIRKVKLPEGCVRGGLLTQAAVLKVTANGTTTSPVVRGAFVMAKLLGRPPEPPPPNIPAVEPDVRGSKTIREQLDKHRTNATCASCHAKIDPPGFALESFDVIGGFRSRYRVMSDGEGDAAPRGSIDPFIGISFKLGPAVDPSGVMPDEQKFRDVQDFKALLAHDKHLLLSNLARQFVIYATGREVAFIDREELAALVARTEQQGGGIRTLLHELVLSPLFQTK